MKTLVVGAAMIDMLMKIEALPKSGEDVLCSESGIVIGGCAYNAANTLRNLESAADLCVPVGKGPYADMIRSELERCGYDILIQDDSQDNGYCLDLVEATGERTFITAQGIEGAFQKKWLDSLDMDQYDSIYVAGYQVCGQGGQAIGEWLCGHGDKQIFFAPGPVICSIDAAVMEKIFSVHPILHLNEKEAMDFTRASHQPDPGNSGGADGYVPAEDILDAVRELHSRTGNLVIVTLGEKGTVYYEGDELHTVPSVKTTVVDTIGAGDSHIGAVIGGLKKGLGREESIRLANRVAAAVVSVQGPVMDKETFEKKMEEHL
ncbi:Ribokinase [Schaedlerella arabinosiphila]|uniref:PfkB family carbohydrate kinase n=1 Tax=Schaedlerella arabinosiphila TaxID=2044587 RepID=UPI0002CBA607|nr:PfkB family carbohydrate kinase [Schaedlerella arabinosiphila]KAI4441325.1 Ribokinase [Schaedlerella arabinosiphila]